MNDGLSSSSSVRRMFTLMCLVALVGCRKEPEWAREPSGEPLPQALTEKIAPGQFFFAENEDSFCAIRFTNEHGWDRAAYESFQIPRGESGPLFPNASRVSGEVFEDFEVKDEWEDKVLVEDAGSQVDVPCGGSVVVWSAGNWIYSWGEWRFAVTKCPTLDCAEEQYPNVTWLEREPEERLN